MKNNSKLNSQKKKEKKTLEEIPDVNNNNNSFLYLVLGSELLHLEIDGVGGEEGGPGVRVPPDLGVPPVAVRRYLKK